MMGILNGNGEIKIMKMGILKARNATLLLTGVGGWGLTSGGGERYLALFVFFCPLLLMLFTHSLLTLWPSPWQNRKFQKLMSNCLMDPLIFLLYIRTIVL